MKRNVFFGIAAALILPLVFFACKEPENTGDTTAPVLSNGSVNRTSDTEATIGFTTDEAGAAYYLVVEANANAPAITAANSASLGAVTAGANSNKSVTLTAGAKDIYVVVVDAAGNISTPLKIAAAAYNSGGGPTDITYTAVQTGGTDGETDSTGIVFTFSESIDGLNLTAAGITLTNGTGAATKGDLNGSGASWTLGITVTTAGNVTVSINKTGIDAETKNVMVYKEGQSAPTLTDITLNSSSVKTDYTQNEQLDLTGLVVTANYSDGFSTTINNYTSNPENGAVLSSTGQITVTITYTEGGVTRTAAFIVNVTGTDPGTGTNGRLTISGLPDGNWGVVVYTSGTNVAYRNVTSNMAASGGLETEGDNVMTIVGLGSESGWTATGSYPVVLSKRNGYQLEGNAYDSDNPAYRLATVNFSGGIGAVSFSAFTPLLSETLTINNLPSYNEDDFSLGGRYGIFIFAAGAAIPATSLGAMVLPDITKMQASSTVVTTLGGSKYYQFVINYQYGNDYGKTGLFDGDGEYPVILNDRQGTILNPIYLVASVNFTKGNATVDYSSFTTFDGTTPGPGPSPTKTLTGITLNTASVKKAYVQNEALDLSSLVVTANYSDDSNVAVTNYTASPADGAALNTTGEITVTISFSEGGVTRTDTFTVNVTAAGTPVPPSITTASLPNGTVGTAYSQTLAASGSTPITWVVETGALPTGLSLSGNTITGNPTTANTFNFTVKATNAGGSNTKALSITIVTSGGTPNSAGITVSVKQIEDETFVFAAIIISRTGSNNTFTVEVENDSDYSSIEWEVAGVGAYAGQTVTGSGASFTLDAADVKYNAIGIHFLILTVEKDGMWYRRAIPFTIQQ